MKVESIPVGKIELGTRRRQDYGNIATLAEGMRRVGLLEPIVVDQNGSGRYRLLAGERRVRAAQLLQWDVIPANLKEHLTEAQFREIELEENENRKPLTEQERMRTFTSSKKLVENAKRAAEVLSHGETKPPGAKGGRPVKPDSVRAVADSLGTDKENIRRAEQHVATAERFPFMQGSAWRQADVLRIHERLKELPEAEREAAATIIGRSELLDPERAAEIIDRLAAAKPDPRIGIVDDLVRGLDAAINPYPDDPATPLFIKARALLQRAQEVVKG
jgi:ParB-like chromosome segregation protein Spo0J